LSSPDSAFVGVQEVVGTMREAGSAVWGDQYPLTVAQPQDTGVWM
jgi:hypothetical protein